MAALPDQRGGGELVAGVVHVGANLGQEIPWYIANAHVPILAFEPLGDIYEQADRLHEQVIRQGTVRLINAALGSKTGDFEMFVAQNSEGTWDTLSASGLGPVLPEAAARLGWQGWLAPYRSKRVKAYCFRFDEWAYLTKLNLAAYDWLVIDAQGMELDVLKGCGDALQAFTHLTVECSEFPVYAGEATALEVCTWLAEHSFTRTSGIGLNTDIQFVKEAA